jgi:hypothetical protein
MSHGVAMVHEVLSNDMPPTHPIRKEWEKLIKACNKHTVRQLYSYINSGFCGVTRENMQFVKEWEEMISKGLEYYKHTKADFIFRSDRSDPFYANDQDALNITSMCSEVPICEMGPEAMDFINGGGFVMSHAISNPKPWMRKYVEAALNGYPQTLAEKEYWKNTTGPLWPFSQSHLRRKKYAMLLASVITRFNRR